MIFNDLKAIFIHVERTGGVALRKHLLNYENHFKRIAKTKHLTSAETKKLVGDLWYKYFKFGFVRNPYERLVSWYHACNQHPEWKSDVAQWMQKYNTFEELILHPHPKMLITQKEKLNEVDWIGRFEYYKEDMIELCDTLDIPYSDLKVNTSKHNNYKIYYNKNIKNIVSNWYKEDLKKFNYTF